jgi:hypothetical protein
MAAPPSWAGVPTTRGPGRRGSSTRSGGVWTQQGRKLVGTGAVGNAGQGISVALSGDGNTAIVGGFSDNRRTGAAWVFTRSGGVWTQQGNKLIGTGAVGSAAQGFSVALSGDGSAAIVGGVDDNSYIGAAWVYSVALSGDGSAAIVGGVDDNSYIGAAWVHTRSGAVWTTPPQYLGF